MLSQQKTAIGAPTNVTLVSNGSAESTTLFPIERPYMCGRPSHGMKPSRHFDWLHANPAAAGVRVVG
jgi:hypothetical protein